MLVFYLAVLPQFLGPATPVAVLLVFALTHATLVLRTSWWSSPACTGCAGCWAAARVRRALDAATGTALPPSAPGSAAEKLYSRVPR